MHQGLDGHCLGPAGGLTGTQDLGLGFRFAGQQYLKADLGLLLFLLSLLVIYELSWLHHCCMGSPKRSLMPGVNIGLPFNMQP